MNLTKIMSFMLLTVLALQIHPVSAMNALKAKQNKITQDINEGIQARERVKKEIADAKAYNEKQCSKLVEENKKNPMSANVQQLLIKPQDLQTGATCGTAALFLAAAIDQVVNKNEAITSDAIHTALESLNYHTNMTEEKFEQNILCERFTDIIKTFDLNKWDFENRTFTLGIEGQVGAAAQPLDAINIEKIERVKGNLARLSLELRKNSIKPIHFICNLNNGHWTLFSVVNSGGTITFWYLDSANGTLSQNASPLKEYISYMREHLLFSAK